MLIKMIFNSFLQLNHTTSFLKRPTEEFEQRLIQLGSTHLRNDPSIFNFFSKYYIIELRPAAALAQPILQL